MNTIAEGALPCRNEKKYQLRVCWMVMRLALTGMGYSITTKLLLVRRAGLMIRRHQSAGLAYFDQTIINCYTGEIDDKYFKGNMQKEHYERSKREIDRLVSYVHTGKSDVLPSTLCGARQRLTPKFEQIAEEFIAGDFHPDRKSVV